MQSSIGATQWILSGSSHIEEIEEDYSSLAEAHYEFTPFHELHAHIGSDKELGVFGIVVDVGPIREVHNSWSTSSKALNVVLLDESLQAITLTLWDILAENEGSQLADLLMKRTVLIANHLKVTTYNGISLSTKTGSSLIINPTFQKLRHFTQWVQSCTEMLLQTIASKDYVLINSTTTSCTPQNKLIPIKHILEHLSSYSQGTKFWVSTTISLKNPTNPLYYMACSLCARGASGNLGEVYSCNYCLHKHAISIPRARCDVDLRDSTGTLQASIIGPVAEQFLGTTSEHLINVHRNEYIDSDSNYHLKYTNVEHSVYVKSGIPDPKTGDPRYSVMYIAENTKPTPAPLEVSINESYNTPPLGSSLSATNPGISSASTRRSLQFIHEGDKHPKKMKLADARHIAKGATSPSSATDDQL